MAKGFEHREPQGETPRAESKEQEGVIAKLGPFVVEASDIDRWDANHSKMRGDLSRQVRRLASENIITFYLDQPPIVGEVPSYLVHEFISAAASACESEFHMRMEYDEYLQQLSPELEEYLGALNAQEDAVANDDYGDDSLADEDSAHIERCEKALRAKVDQVAAKG